MERDEYDEDEVDFVRHLDALGVPHPYGSADARRVGLDRNTEEGALLAFSAALRPEKVGHRAVAWVLLVAFGVPVVLVAWHLLGGLIDLLVG